MAGALVLPNPAHALRIDAPERHGIERLAPETLHDLVVQPVVLAIEAALELGARPPLEVEPARRLPRHLRHESRPLVHRLRPQAHPQEVFDDVGLDQRPVDVEHREDVGAAGALLDGGANGIGLWLGRRATARLAALARDRLRPGPAHDRWKVDVLEVMLPLVKSGVEWKRLAL